MKNKAHRQTLKYVIIKNSKIHGKGIYAKKDIKKGIKIIEYVGEIVTKDEGNKRAANQYKLARKNKNLGSVYVFELNNKYDLDGNVSWNPAKYINHSCKPNCKYKQEGLKIWIVSKKNIKKDEEISYDYGYDLEDYKNNKCLCGSKNCIGYIVGKSFRKELQKKLKKKKK